MKHVKQTTEVFEEEAALTLELRDHLIRMGEICQRLGAIEPNMLQYFPKCRRVWVSGVSSEKAEDPHQCLPAFKLSGKWLSVTGFHAHQWLQIIALNKLLVICPESLLRDE